uniref:Uncharacterized protein n=1 Tax=Anopheles darlingi TaxID=43151 RepID=A0A2M4DEW7_ANODA
MSFVGEDIMMVVLLLWRSGLWSVCDRMVGIVAVRMYGCICSALLSIFLYCKIAFQVKQDKMDTIASNFLEGTCMLQKRI